MQAKVQQANIQALGARASTHVVSTPERRRGARNESEHQIVRHFTPGRIPMLIRQPAIERTNRIIDIVGALVGLLFAAPLLLACIAVIKATSRGPAFFVQIRVGRGGKLFRMYKLRTMVQDAQRQQKNLMALNEQEGPAFKIKNDPRVTRFGRFLRKFSIDEIPQFLNVLKGEMSLVGPRPPLPREVKSYQRWHLQRLTVKPGLTGLWQVSGRNRLNFDEWVRLDIRYIKQRSLIFDLKLMIRTIKVVLFKPDGA